MMERSESSSAQILQGESDIDVDAEGEVEIPDSEEASLHLQDQSSSSSSSYPQSSSNTVIHHQPIASSSNLSASRSSRSPEQSIEIPATSTSTSSNSNPQSTSTRSSNPIRKARSKPRDSPIPITITKKEPTVKKAKSVRSSETLKKAFQQRIKNKASLSPSLNDQSDQVNNYDDDLFAPPSTSRREVAGGSKGPAEKLLQEAQRRIAAKGKRSDGEKSTEELAHELLTRLRYASVKLSHGWKKQTLSEVETMLSKKESIGSFLSYSSPSSSNLHTTSTPSSSKGKQRATLEDEDQQTSNPSSSTSRNSISNRAEIAQILARRGASNPNSSVPVGGSSTNPTPSKYYPSLFGPTPKSGSKLPPNTNSNSAMTYPSPFYSMKTPLREDSRIDPSSIRMGRTASSSSLNSPSIEEINNRKENSTRDGGIDDLDSNSSRSRNATGSSTGTNILNGNRTSMLGWEKNYKYSYHRGSISNSRRGTGIRGNGRTSSLSPLNDSYPTNLAPPYTSTFVRSQNVNSEEGTVGSNENSSEVGKHSNPNSQSNSDPSSSGTQGSSINSNPNTPRPSSSSSSIPTNRNDTQPSTSKIAASPLASGLKNSSTSSTMNSSSPSIKTSTTPATGPKSYEDFWSRLSFANNKAGTSSPVPGSVGGKQTNSTPIKSEALEKKSKPLKSAAVGSGKRNASSSSEKGAGNNKKKKR